MKALGKGSIASFLRTALFWVWCALLLAAGALVLVAIVGMVVGGLLASGVIKIDLGDRSALSYLPFAVPVWLIGAVSIGGSLAVIWRLRRLFANFSSGEPFHKSNADHLRAIWITLLLMEVSRYLLMAITGALLVAFGPPIDHNKDINFHGPDLSTWFMILIIIVLAEVFREGARLREEQELTI